MRAVGETLLALAAAVATIAGVRAALYWWCAEVVEDEAPADSGGADDEAHYGGGDGGAVAGSDPGSEPHGALGDEEEEEGDPQQALAGGCGAGTIVIADGDARSHTGEEDYIEGNQDPRWWCTEVEEHEAQADSGGADDEAHYGGSGGRAVAGSDPGSEPHGALGDEEEEEGDPQQALAGGDGANHIVAADGDASSNTGGEEDCIEGNQDPSGEQVLSDSDSEDESVGYPDEYDTQAPPPPQPVFPPPPPPPPPAWKAPPRKPRTLHPR